MLYHLHEFGSLAATPIRFAAEAQQLLLRHPMNPLSYTPNGRALAATAEMMDAALRPYDKPAFGLDRITVADKSVPVVEEIVLEKPFCQLRHFAKSGAKSQRRLLIVAPLSGHFATLLRGTVAAMLLEHDVYITDWRDARGVPLTDGGFDLDDYIDYTIEFLRFLGPNTHVMAVCQPAVPVLAAVSMMAAARDDCTPASMILMGGPIDTRISPTKPDILAKTHSLQWFEQNLISRVPFNYRGFMRRVYPGFLQLTGFMAMNMDRHISAHMKHFNHLVEGDGDSAEGHRNFYNEYRAVMDLPAEYYLQTVERVFQNHDLALGSFKYRGQLIDPAGITETALMTVEGELDDISGPGQTLAAHEICSSLASDMRENYLQRSVGHYGVFNGRRWRDHIAPRVTAFIKAHDQARRGKPN